MQEGRTIIDYPDVDSFMADVELEIRKARKLGFGAHVLHDPYAGHGLSLEYVTKNRTCFSTEWTAGLSESLFAIDIMTSPPFDVRKFNTLGEEDSGPSNYRTIGIRISVLCIQIQISFCRS